ncbi:peptidase M48-like protein [Sphingomonas sp. PP-F2F-A104-K0414]|uniref:M48 family metallopeptidase n=1 Tax=Sphingomonas sp. PP-F2F-A104-K0414 TaxID=2135661 RepID=UPI0010538A02|nr:M48 family metallopeptidase [Sphingomonas sp. PP-F2F-A104-K0414]TCP97048.1 peptidase M48-like protein [Sphingomonas sp. PP-F2F-A104-K0414]
MIGLLLAGVMATGAAAADKRLPLPTYGQAYTPTTVDERGIWMEADEDERRLRDSPSVIRDPALNAYVRGVLCRTVGEDRCKSVRIYIEQVPAFNASMSPNGTMVVWTGLLLRVRNEAELGSILGHEFGHFELRHSLKDYKNRRRGSDLMAWASVLLRNSGDIRYSTVGQFYAFDRQQEQDADMIGFQYLARSRYPSSASADVWDHIMSEADATAIGRKGRAQHKYVAGFFATHPTNLARATYLRAASIEAADVKPALADAHHDAMTSWLPVFLNDQIKLNDFGGSEYVLANLAESGGWTTPLLIARGDLYRERGNPRDLVSAAQFYQEAIARGDAPPEAYRGLGLSLLRSQQVADGSAALTTYLRLKPATTDAALIATLVSQ